MTFHSTYGGFRSHGGTPKYGWFYKLYIYIFIVDNSIKNHDVGVQVYMSISIFSGSMLLLYWRPKMTPSRTGRPRPKKMPLMSRGCSAHDGKESKSEQFLRKQRI